MTSDLPNPWHFAATFIAVFFVSSVVLFAIDFVPEKPTPGGTVAGTSTPAVNDAAEPEEPVSISIPAIGVRTSVGNPTSTSIAVLDEALLSGAVRYPTSAVLGEQGTVYLFGHQSYLPIVKNQAFKAFNDLQKLDIGDEIEVYSENSIYTYRVRTVELVDANETLIPLETGEQKLVLSTCNSFGDPGERYVVTARFISKVAEDGA